MNLHLLTADAYFFHRSRNLWDGIYYIRLYMFLCSNEPHVWDDVLRFRDALLIQTWRCAALTRRVQKLPVGDKEQNISCFHNEKSVNAIRSLCLFKTGVFSSVHKNVMQQRRGSDEALT